MKASYNQITDLTAARTLAYGLAGGQPAGSMAALLQPETVAVRWRDDGGDPTATAGFLLNPGDVLYYDEGPVANIKVIGTAPGSVLNVSIYFDPNV